MSKTVSRNAGDDVVAFVADPIRQLGGWRDYFTREERRQLAEENSQLGQ